MRLNDTKKIALVDHVGSKAGMDYYSYFLAAGLTELGRPTTVFSNFERPDAQVQFKQFFIGHTDSKFAKLGNHLSAYAKTARYCKKKGFKQAIVHLFSYGLKDVYGLVMLKAAGMQIFAIVHDVETFAEKDTPFLQKLILTSLADRIMVHNRFSLAVLEEKFGKAIAAKTAVIPHGNFDALASDKPTKQAARKELGLPEQERILLFFGQIKDVKGLDILLRAMPMVQSDIKLLIAGKPWKSDFRQYEELILSLGIQDRVQKMIGFVPDNVRHLLFTASDAIVLPYRKIYQSGVMLMAMSYELPLLASDLPPVKEIIRSGANGLLFASEQPESLAQRINEMFSARESLPAFAAAAAKDSRDNHDWKKIAQAVINTL